MKPLVSAVGRAEILALVEPQDYVLEIGPFTKPILTGPNVKYFDVLDKLALIKRAKEKGYPHDRAVEIDFVSPIGDLSIVTGMFDVCVSSHCVEHQPDLVRHLNQVAALLRQGGRYILIIPDKRFCFDHFLPPSTIADVLDAEGRSVHTIGNIVRHRALVTHNDPSRHWAGDHGKPRLLDNIEFLHAALREHAAAAGGYVDVHAWQFTPESFRDLVNILATLNRIPLTCEMIYPTPYHRFEFCAVLKR